MKEEYVIIGAFTLWNLTVFLMYGLDKLKARRNAWRISERTLLLSALLLGGVGAWFGMRKFHHKSLHTSFRIIVPLSAAITLIALGFMLKTTG
ncbi:MAG: DUF1294 domain-containing protein [Erysipelotrichaceae bacterium]|nr:DUF1294 domain-containing protein [Erysipelotrichaceae bacterium]